MQVEIPVLFPLIYQMPFFNFFHPETLLMAIEACTVRQLQAQEDIVSMGDKVGALFIVITGKVALSRTELDGREIFILEKLPGSVFGEFSLLCDDAFSATATALESSVVVHVPISALSPVFRNQPQEVVNCLVYHEAKEYHKHDDERMEAEKDFVWGSKQWNKLRKDENAYLQQRMALICHVHVFSHDQTGSAKSHIEMIADTMNDEGKTVYDFDKSQPPINVNVTMEMKSKDDDRQVDDPSVPGIVKVAENPILKFKIEFFCSDRVQPYKVAFREIADATEPDPYAIAVLKKYSASASSESVRKTPDGIIFDIERDLLRENAEVARIDAYMQKLHNDKRINRGAAVWEKMPFMFFVDGVFNREWDRAADRRAEYSSGNFREMSSIIERIKVGFTVHSNARVEETRSERAVRQGAGCCNAGHASHVGLKSMVVLDGPRDDGLNVQDY